MAARQRLLFTIYCNYTDNYYRDGTGKVQKAFNVRADVHLVSLTIMPLPPINIFSNSQLELF